MATHPEALLISAVIRTKDYVTPMHHGIGAHLFHVHQAEWRWIERYIARRKKAPSKGAFKAKFPTFGVKAVDDVDHYTDEVKREHARYVLSEAMDQAINLMEQDEVGKALAHLHAQSISIQSQVEGESTDFDLVKDWEEVYADVSNRVDRVSARGMAGIPTGFGTLDLLTGGPQPGDFWVIGARLGMGKTWTLIRMASAALYDGHKSQYDALEQNYRQIAFRFHTFLSSKYGKECFQSLALIKGKGFNLMAYKKFLQGLHEHVQSTIYISDTSRGRVSPLTIAAQIERNKPDIVFIDYLTLMEQTGDDWRAIAKLSSEIKQLAQRYEVPIVAAAQINRVGSGKEPPKAEHLGGSDAIGQDADCVVTMAQQSKSVMKLRLAKYRHGADGDTWYCEFTPGTGRFEEVSGDRAQELTDYDRDED